MSFDVHYIILEQSSEGDCCVFHSMHELEETCLISEVPEKVTCKVCLANMNFYPSEA